MIKTEIERTRIKKSENRKKIGSRKNKEYEKYRIKRTRNTKNKEQKKYGIKRISNRKNRDRKTGKKYQEIKKIKE